MGLKWYSQDDGWAALFPGGIYRKAMVTVGDSGLWVRLFENGEVIRVSFPFPDLTAAQYEAALMAKKEGWLKGDSE